MKKILALAMAAVVLTACEKSIVDEELQTPNATLQVTTRGTNDAVAAYPVQVYVFQNDICRAVQTIGDAGQTLNIALTEGTYSVYAIGGAASASYNLPAKEDATTSTALTLKEGVSMTDLMAASATATLVDGGTNTVTLGLARKVMMIQDVEIKKIPTAATAVSVTFAPLWQNITVGANYAGTTGSSTIALAKQSDGRTWKNTASAYLLPPSSQPASVSVNITIGGTTKTYTYSTSDQLEAGYKINIDGTYTEAVGVALMGTITGATWLGERTISFSFNESSVVGGTTADNDDNNTAPTDYPAAGSTYQGCYVLAADVADDGQSAELTLLSPSEATCVGTEAAVSAALATLGTAAVSGWELPTKSQMQLVEAKLLSDDASLSGAFYLFRKSDNGIGYHKLGGTSWATVPNTTAAYRLRPVAVVTVAKK
ncbi:MAG: hypothetical protein IKG81_03805 [Bacteroidales bacterium]|nr:hypothetical protein [Bacteroidales bacterium]